MNGFINITMSEYLADLGRTSGSDLSMVATDPERYGLKLAGKDVDRTSAAMGRGSYFHARILEPDTVSSSFAFYPSRNTPTEPVMREELGPRGGKKLVPTDELEPQDGSDRGANKSIKRVSAGAKKAHADFLESARGLTIVYPEDQPVVGAMVRAVQRHEEAAELLAKGFEPEVTGWWTCSETGERMKIRPDGIRLTERKWVELKSVSPKGPDDRLDTGDPAWVVRQARQGWGRKDALLHDGCYAITGDPWGGYWIVVEALPVEALARGAVPRVSVVPTYAEVDRVPSLYQLGRNGGGGIPGYLELVRRAQTMRAAKDFRHECTKGKRETFALPYWLEQDMMIADTSPVALKGARVVTGG